MCRGRHPGYVAAVESGQLLCWHSQALIGTAEGAQQGPDTILIRNSAALRRCCWHSCTAPLALLQQRIALLCGRTLVARILLLLLLLLPLSQVCRPLPHVLLPLPLKKPHHLAPKLPKVACGSLADRLLPLLLLLTLRLPGWALVSCADSICQPPQRGSTVCGNLLGLLQLQGTQLCLRGLHLR